MNENKDPDLPGEQTARAAFVVTPGFHPENGMTAKTIAEQEAILHNQMRYAELEKLRRGQPNVYNETRYR